MMERTSWAILLRNHGAFPCRRCKHYRKEPYAREDGDTAGFCMRFMESDPDSGWVYDGKTPPCVTGLFEPVEQIALPTL